MKYQKSIGFALAISMTLGSLAPVTAQAMRPEKFYDNESKEQYKTRLVEIDYLEKQATKGIPYALLATGMSATLTFFAGLGTGLNKHDVSSSGENDRGFIRVNNTLYFAEDSSSHPNGMGAVGAGVAATCISTAALGTCVRYWWYGADQARDNAPDYVEAKMDKEISIWLAKESLKYTKNPDEVFNESSAFPAKAYIPFGVERAKTFADLFLAEDDRSHRLAATQFRTGRLDATMTSHFDARQEVLAAASADAGPRPADAEPQAETNLDQWFDHYVVQIDPTTQKGVDHFFVTECCHHALAPKCGALYAINRAATCPFCGVSKTLSVLRKLVVNEGFSARNLEDCGIPAVMTGPSAAPAVAVVTVEEGAGHGRTQDVNPLTVERDPRDGQTGNDGGSRRLRRSSMQ
jgi:hypothetical protein